MTLVEGLLPIVRSALGHKLAQRVHGNLPSRKPQLWERLPRALIKRAEVAFRARLEAGWLDRSTVVSLPEFGLLMEVVPKNQFIDFPVFVFGVYEVSGTRFLQSVLVPGMTVIDVGANAGYYSLVAAGLVGHQGRVHAFEPVPFTHEKLQRNVRLNSLTQISTYRTAVTAESGRAFIHASTVQGNDGLASLLPGPGRTESAELVTAISLDDFVRQMPDERVDLIKVDVEGAEELVFRGAQEVLCPSEAPALLFESFRVKPIAQTLQVTGYEVRHLHYSLKNGLEFPRLGESYDNVFGAYEGINYVAIKPGQRFGSFEEISARSKCRIPRVLRLLGALA